MPTAEAELVDVGESMAFEILVGRAGRRFAPLSAQSVVRHILEHYAGAGFPVQEAALEALVERARDVRRDGLEVVARPRVRKHLGEYRVGGRGVRRLPFRILVTSLSPLGVSCDCPDFLTNSLGLCAHGLVALGEAIRRCGVREKRGASSKRRRSEKRPAMRVDWDPIRPLEGSDQAHVRLRALEGAPFAAGWAPLGDGWLRPPDDDGAAFGEFIAALAQWARHHPNEVAPAARAIIAAAAEEAERRAHREAMAPLALDALDRLRRPLYPYQREGVTRFLAAGRLLLGDDMGLGKTAQAIGACHAMSRSGLARRGLLVVPAPLKQQWAREWRAFSDMPVHVVEGRPDARRDLYASTSQGGFLIINYELLRRDIGALFAWAPDVMVLDEAQRIKNPETQTAQTVKALTPAYRLALTGTPLENRLGELASIMDWVDADALSPAWRVRAAHGSVRDGAVFRLGTIRERMAGRFLRRRRSEILTELKGRTDSVVPVELTVRQREPHQRIRRKVARLLELTRHRPMSPAERLRLMALLTQQRIIANGMAQVRFEDTWPEIEAESPSQELLARLHTPKLLSLRQLLGALVVDQGRKVVVFSQWRRMLRLAEWATRDVLASAAARSVFFTGKESTRARDRSVVELHDDPDTRVLFATDCASVGLNLQRAATACVNIELPWNPAVLEQRIARLHRIGQREPIDVVNLITTDSIETRIAYRIEEKRAVFEGLLDSEVDGIDFEPSRTWWEVANAA